jgi:hypothetical protein
MKANKLKWTVRSVCLLTAFAASAETITYIVKKGDTLSQIAHKHIPGAIYGNNGSLAKVLSFNPEIKNPDKIYVGRVINLEMGVPLRQVAQVPPPAMAPPSNFGSMADNDQHPFGNFSARLGFDFFRINATDNVTGANATILSNMNPSLSIAWKEQWSDNWATRLRLNYESLNLQSPTPRTMSNPTASAYGFGLGVERSFGDSWGLTADVGYDQQFFLESASTQSLTLDTVALLNASLTGRYDFFKRKNTAVGANLQVGYLGSGSNNAYTINAGNFYGGQLYLHQDLPTWKATLTGDVFYKQTSQNTSLVNQTQTDVGAGVGLSWTFGNPGGIPAK